MNINKIAGKDLTADNRGADFSKEKITARAVGSTGTLALSGCFAGANFRGAEFLCADLSGDFSGADFQDSTMLFCTLSGNFNSARNLGLALKFVDSSPEATFQAADLRGAEGGFDPEQIMDAQIGYWDRIAVRSGTVQILREQYQLCVPAQFSEGINVADVPSARILDLSHIQDRPPWGDLYDVTKIAKEVDGIYTRPLHDQKRPLRFVQDTSPRLHLNAPNIVFRNFHRKMGVLELHGNFDGASFRDSNIPIIALEWGTFHNFDLTTSTVKAVRLNMDGIEAKGLGLPSGVQRVAFSWYTKKKQNEFHASPQYAPQIIDAWNSKLHCDHMATKIAGRLSGNAQVEAWDILNSRAKTTRGAKRKHFTFFTPELEIIAGLVARRNQL
jgi:hypothetical protein